MISRDQGLRNFRGFYNSASPFTLLGKWYCSYLPCECCPSRTLFSVVFSFSRRHQNSEDPLEFSILQAASVSENQSTVFMCLQI